MEQNTTKCKLWNRGPVYNLQERVIPVPGELKIVKGEGVVVYDLNGVIYAAIKDLLHILSLVRPWVLYPTFCTLIPGEGRSFFTPQ